jgi:hypothetical protein
MVLVPTRRRSANPSTSRRSFSTTSVVAASDGVSLAVSSLKMACPTMRGALGSLDRVDFIVKLLGMVKKVSW